VLQYQDTSMIDTLEALRQLGVRLEVDDFGTGYSSLSTLHTFPLYALKVDQSFVRRLGALEDSWELVQTIVTLAHNLGLDVVAEGVETEMQLDAVRQLGCDYAQGYFFSAPVSQAQVHELLVLEKQW
jgi:EAL domain-containing protein (putative c-di-GMP-specific phosphodiesterase class I)